MFWICVSTCIVVQGISPPIFSQASILSTGSSEFEKRVIGLNEELMSLRQLISEKESIITKLRIDVNEANQKGQKGIALVKSFTTSTLNCIQLHYSCTVFINVRKHCVIGASG